MDSGRPSHDGNCISGIVTSFLQELSGEGRIVLVRRGVVVVGPNDAGPNDIAAAGG